MKDKLPAIVDAAEPGGGGDRYAGLNDEERATLAENKKADSGTKRRECVIRRGVSGDSSTPVAASD
jgi:hypothetical protein